MILATKPNLKFSKYDKIIDMKNMKSLLILWVSLLVTVVTFSQTSDSRIALVIGNKDYIENNLSLTNPVNDANAIEKALELCNFKVIKIINADKETIEKYVNNFTEQLKYYDVGLFYYSGHGIEATLDGDRKNFIVPVSASSQMTNADVNYKCINSEWIQAKMVEAGRENKTNILIFDACRDNPFRRLKRSLEGEAWVRPPKVPTGVITCYSTSPNKSASDGDGNNGLYTSILLKYIRVPNINVETVFKRVRIEMGKLGQQPQELNELTTDFYFRTTTTPPDEEINVTKPKSALENLKTQTPTKQLILEALSLFEFDKSSNEANISEAKRIMHHVGIYQFEQQGTSHLRGNFGSGQHMTIWVKTYNKLDTYGVRIGEKDETYFEIVKQK